jgi:transcriptional regulator with PAS, ATPase and Fis domain
VRYEDEVVGALVRVPALAAASRAAARAAARAAPTMAVARYDFGQILGESAPALQAIALARVASRNELPVVIHGESGTGKEMFAQAIHSSARTGGPFIPMNCAASRRRSSRPSLRTRRDVHRCRQQEARQVRGGQRRDGLSMR